MSKIDDLALNQEQRKLEDEKKRVKKDDLKTIQTSFYEKDELLLEQIHSDGLNTFLMFNAKTEEIQNIPLLTLSDAIIKPNNGEDVTLGAIKLPSCITEYENTLSLLEELKTHIHRYLDLSPDFLIFTTYYILLSWLFDCFRTLPYLRALGDTGCGKSRFLDVIRGLCYKAIIASGCVTPAPIYRMLKKWRGTLVLDEADLKSSDEYNEVITILNCGFECGRPVIRATRDNPENVQILPVYSPKVFATRRRFQDVAMEARCLTEIMKETDRDDIPSVLTRKFFAEEQVLRNKLLLFRFRNYHKVDPEAISNLKLDGIEPRLRQISEAITSLFANEPHVLQSYKTFIKKQQKELIEQRAITNSGQVVQTLFELIERSVTRVTRVTTETGDSVYDITAKDIGDKLGLSPQATGQILKSLGLETILCKIDGISKRRIANKPRIFIKLKKRYILEEEQADDE